jgi:two-component system, cell cycle sensor histidine kinase and response regulator CckA
LLFHWQKKGSMATSSSVQSERQQDTTSSVPLEALPFPSALLDSTGLIVCTNSEWDKLHPSFPAGADAASYSPDRGFQEGLHRVLAGERRRFTHSGGVCESGLRATISKAPQGALLVLEETALSMAARLNTARLETVGRTVSGVVHDFANLLTLIGGYGDLLLGRMDEQDPNREEIGEIRQAAEQGGRLTSQLLEFTRGASREPELLDLNALAGDVQRMLRPLLGEHVEVAADLEPQLAKVMADRGQLEQVVMNLLLNARDAMPAGGRIRLETSSAVLGEDEASSLGMAPGATAVLSVSDTGKGIPPEAIDHIFQPFYTTKAKGDGTGLGLSIVQGVVKECGGAIRVLSSPGAGARFMVYLPASAQPAESGEPEHPEIPVARGSETVLVVEDDAAVGRLMAKVLKQQGYKVLTAGNGEEALHVLDSKAPNVRLVLTDIVMPRMGGHELARRIRAWRPALPIIFVSGYTEEVLSRRHALDPGMSFLRKPLHPAELASRVREVLDSCSLPFNPR